MGILDIPGIARTTADGRYAARPPARIRTSGTLPAVHPDPPTIAVPVDATAAGLTVIGSTTGTAISGPQQHLYWVGGVGGGTVNTSRFTRHGWTLYDRFNYGQARNPDGFTGGGYPAAVEFIHTGSVFEIKFFADGGSGYRLYVDDMPVTLGMQTPTIVTSHVMLIPVTFSGRGTRKIRIEFQRTFAFGGIIIETTAALQAAQPRPRGQVLLLGDSYSDGANGVAALDTYAHQLGRLLDADMWIDAQGGTGLVATGGGGTKGDYLGRLTGASSEARLNPEIVILQGSTNDANGNEAGVTAATTSAVAAVRSLWPRAKLVVTGVLYPRGTAYLGSGMATDNTNLGSVASASADLFIDAIAENWFTGDGRVGTTTENGSADFFMSSDAVHPADDGHEFLATMLARKISGLLSAI